MTKFVSHTSLSMLYVPYLILFLSLNLVPFSRKVLADTDRVAMLGMETNENSDCRYKTDLLSK